MSAMDDVPSPNAPGFDPSMYDHRRSSLPQTDGLRAAAISIGVWEPAMRNSTMRDRLADAGVYYDGRFKQHTDDGTRLLFPDTVDY